MSWNDEDIDRMFKEAADQQEVPFREEFWTEVEALLPKQKKNSLAIYWLAGSFIGLLGLSSLFFLETEQTTTAATMAGKESLNFPASNLISKKSNSTTHALTHGNSINATHPFTNPLKAISSQERMTENGTELPVAPDNNLSNHTTENEQLFTQDRLEKWDNLQLKTVDLLENPISIYDVMAVSYSNPRQKNHSFYAQLNAGNPWSPSYAATVGYVKRLNQVSFDMGTRFSVLSAENLTISREAKVYHFSSTLHTLDLNYKNMYHLEVPLRVGYSIKKHTLSAGITPSYLLSTRMAYSKYENGNLVAQDQIFGQRIGLRNFNVSVEASYSLELMKNLHAGIQVSSFLMNPILPNTLNGEANKQAFNVQVSLRKFIF